MAIVERIGFIRGNTILKKTPIGELPSILAASSIAIGMLLLINP